MSLKIEAAEDEASDSLGGPEALLTRMGRRAWVALGWGRIGSDSGQSLAPTVEMVGGAWAVVAGDSGTTACESVGGERSIDGVYCEPPSELYRRKRPVVESLSKPQKRWRLQSFPIRKPLTVTSTSFVVAGSAVMTARLTSSSNSGASALRHPYSCVKFRKE